MYKNRYYFKINYIVSAVCGGTLMGHTGGNFSTPGYDGVKNYTSKLNCEWTIENPSHHNSSIYISFEDFHLEHHQDCQYDYVELRIGLYAQQHNGLSLSRFWLCNCVCSYIFIYKYIYICKHYLIINISIHMYLQRLIVVGSVHLKGCPCSYACLPCCLLVQGLDFTDIAISAQIWSLFQGRKCNSGT